MRRPRRSIRGSRQRMARVLDAPTAISATRHPRATTTATRPLHLVETARAQVAAARGRRACRKSSGRRAPPKPTIWRFSASRTITASTAGTSSPRAPSTRRCSILAANSNGAAGGSRTWPPDSGGVDPCRPGRPPRCGRTRCWCRSCTSTTRSASFRISRPIAARLRAARRGRGCTWMRRRASARCAVDFAALGVDLMSLSAHKAYGPKGVGALLVSRARRGAPRASHAAAIRRRTGARACAPGTLATHQVVGMGLAFELAARHSPDRSARASCAAGTPVAGTGERSAACCATAMRGSRVPHLLNVSFEGVEGESLLAAVRGRLAVSTGSACTSALQEPSYVLRALGRRRASERKQPAVWPRPLHDASADIDMAAIAAVSATRCRALRRIERPRELQRSDAALFRDRRGGGHSGRPATSTAAARAMPSQGTWVQFDVQRRRRNHPCGAISWRLAARTSSRCRRGSPNTRSGTAAARQLPRERAGLERPLRGARRKAGTAADDRGCLGCRARRGAGAHW